LVSIKDVAREAGVSDKTVSRVVNREPNVHPGTVEKVERAIALLNYVPNLSARLIRTNRSRTVGVMTDLVSTTPYSGDIVRGIQDWAKVSDKTVLIINTGGDPKEEERAWRTFLEHRADGVIYATMFHREANLLSTELPLPTVMVNCFSAADPEIPAIVPDDYGGSLRLVDHLLDQGHRRIAHVRLNPTLKAAHLRIAAYRDAQRARGIAIDESLIVDGMDGEVGRDRNLAFESTLELLSRDLPPTAIFCGNDEIALQVYCAILSRGLQIPGDLSVVGFDDFQTVSNGLRPKLTTAALPYFKMGYEGASLLETLLGGGRATGASFLDCPLVLRGSTGRPEH
jgi:LacI family transcriptional regulator